MMEFGRWEERCVEGAEGDTSNTELYSIVYRKSRYVRLA